MTKPTLAPEWPRMYSNSRGWSLALTGTMVRPAYQPASSSETYSGTLRITSATRSPGVRPSRPRSCPAITAPCRTSSP